MYPSSKLLGYSVVLGGMAFKVPQIMKIQKNRSAAGKPMCNRAVARIHPAREHPAGGLSECKWPQVCRSSSTPWSLWCQLSHFPSITTSRHRSRRTARAHSSSRRTSSSSCRSGHARTLARRHSLPAALLCGAELQWFHASTCALASFRLPTHCHTVHGGDADAFHGCAASPPLRAAVQALLENRHGDVPPCCGRLRACPTPTACMAPKALRSRPIRVGATAPPPGIDPAALRHPPRARRARLLLSSFRTWGATWSCRPAPPDPCARRSCARRHLCPGRCRGRHAVRRERSSGAAVRPPRGAVVLHVHTPSCPQRLSDCTQRQAP